MPVTTRGTKPPAADAPLWGGSSVNITKPTTTLLDEGYATQTTPGSADWNWITNFVSAGVVHNLIYGIAVWDTDEEYVVGSRVNRNNVIFYSRVAANQGNIPESSGTQWHDTRLPLPFAISTGTTQSPQADFDEVLRVNTTAADIAITINAGMFDGQRVIVEVTGGNNAVLTIAGLPLQVVATGNKLIVTWSSDAAAYLFDRPLSVSGAAPWVPATNYSTAGTIVDRAGFQYAAFRDAGNTGQDPLLEAGKDFWFKPKSLEVLLELATNGDIVSGGMTGMLDRAGTYYRQNMKIAEYVVDGTVKEFHEIALDGTVLTGNGTLETLTDDGGANEWAYIDLYAPDNLGTRTFIDMGGRVTEDQTSGGVVDTMGEVHDDVMQKITGEWENDTGIGVIRASGSVSGVFKLGAAKANVTQSAAIASNNVAFDNSGSTSPNAAKTDDDRTAHAALVTGISYVVVTV